MPNLEVYKNNRLMNTFVISKNVTKIGRDIDNDLMLVGESVSRHHAIIRKDNEYHHVVDQSTNGTFINGRKIKKRKVNKGDTIVIDEWKLVFDPSGSKVNNQQTGVKKINPPKPLLYAVENNLLVSQKLILEIYEQGGRKPREFEIKSAVTRIGSAKDNDVVIRDDYSSSYHARIIINGDRFYVENLDFVNGLMVNGIHREEHELCDDSTIELGNSVIKFRIVTTDENVEPLECHSFHGIVSKDLSMQLLFNDIEKVAPLNNIISIFGESGTGKDLVANVIHKLSPRSEKGKFISINCGAIPRELVESELFGHEKGSFTGAVSQRIGAFEEASRGTLFLDEISELELQMQAKLLRVIQNKSVKRIGRNDEMPIDARIIIATNKE